MNLRIETQPDRTLSDRRRFLLKSTAALCVGSLALPSRLIYARPESLTSKGLQERIFKSVKWGMIKEQLSVKQKFALMKSLGYDGMELESPIGLEANEVRAASEALGMPVHGVVNMKHWKVRLSSPDEKVRHEAVAILEQCLRESADFGGDSVLLVPGRVGGQDETHDHVWQRSIEGIRKALPLASRLGVRILIENVWNGFCETPEALRDYIDEFESPWVGCYFDIGNVQKFSPSAQWIRTLGSRIVKLDVKDWGKEAGFGKIGDGDVDWPDVRKALQEIQFAGWCTAEVKGGKRERLQEIGKRIDMHLLASE